MSEFGLNFLGFSGPSRNNKSLDYQDYWYSLVEHRPRPSKQLHLKICLEYSLPPNICLASSILFRFSAQELPLQRGVPILPSVEKVATSSHHSYPPTHPTQSHSVSASSPYCLFFIALTTI